MSMNDDEQEVLLRINTECVHCPEFDPECVTAETFDDPNKMKMVMVIGYCKYDWVVPPCFLEMT